MKHTSRSISVILALVLAVTTTSHALKLPNGFVAAQAVSPAAPPPSQIPAARTVFLTNSGDDPNFPIDTTESLNAIYAALQAWGHYQMVSSPAQADLVFQLRGVAPITDVTGTRGGVYSVTSPAFQLTILDPKTNVALWTVTSPVNLAGKGQTRARWVTLAENDLVSRIKVRSNQPLSASETANLTVVPNYHHKRNALILVGLTVGFAVAGALILHHEYENGLASQKAQQDAFCEAHDIPLSMCAGG
jgi:hypothetical protein